MKTFKKQAAQGDVFFIKRGKQLPKGKRLTEAKREGNKIVVAHSETGHHHAFTVQNEDAVRLFSVENDPFTMFLQVSEDATQEEATLYHHREYDTHEAIGFEPGYCYEVRRQREHTPEGFRMVMD